MMIALPGLLVFFIFLKGEICKTLSKSCFYLISRDCYYNLTLHAPRVCFLAYLIILNKSVELDFAKTSYFVR